MSSYCTCERPDRTRDYPDSCYCGKLIVDWPSLFAEWFDRLEELAECKRLRLHCEARELAGRETFGQSHLHRRNIVECLQELSDAVNYLAFHDAQHEDTDEITRQMTAAHYIALAYRELTD